MEEENRFQLGFGWKELLAFLFFTTLSLFVAFFLGFSLGKNQATFKPASEEINLQTKPSSDKPIKKKAVVKSKKTKAQSSIDKELLAKNDYAIQIAAYTNVNSASRLQKKLKSAFFPSYIKTSSVDGVTYYRVRVGSYSLQKAKEVSKKITKQFSEIKKVRIIKIK